MINTNYGPIYTQGNSFRARAEAVQRQYRGEILNADYCKYGHLLDEKSAREGANFVSKIAFKATCKRYKQGKGVSKRTFVNILSSQAMCFNIFAPLAANLELASSVFSCIIPSIAAVSFIEFEYTPPKDIFEDQSEISGVDCDLLVKGTTINGSTVIIVIETKFVEPDFSSCGFKAICQADDADIKKEDNDCLYWKRKGYLYWKRTWEAGSLKPSVLHDKECPFRGSLWQLWVNHTLAKTIALRQEASSSIFAICSSENNKSLMGLIGKDKLDNFRQLLFEPDSVMHIGVNHLISVIGKIVKSPLDKKWYEQLAKRYSDI